MKCNNRFVGHDYEIAFARSSLNVEILLSNCVMCSHTGKKQDLWYVVDLLTGEKQQTLTSSFAEMFCPSSSLLYLGRTGKSKTNPATRLTDTTIVSVVHPVQLLILIN